MNEPSVTQDSEELIRIARYLGLSYQEQLPDPEGPFVLIRGEIDRIAGPWGREMMCVPLMVRNNKVVVATADPLNIEALQQLELCFGRELEIIVAPPEEVYLAITQIRTALMQDRSSTLEGAGSTDDEWNAPLRIDVTDSEDADAPIIRYVNSVIFRAAQRRASDIHIEPYEDRYKVRFRIDGVLYEVDQEDKSSYPSVVSRMKVMAGLNIAEKRLPQDGRIGIGISGRDVDIRVSTIPTQFGERIVLRLLEKSGKVLKLEQLGIEGELLSSVERLIAKPNGIILVTGPTGSGKTTTLYSCLSRINTPDLNILTVEDPVEYQLDGIGQMQVNPKIDFTFATGLRAILRQDPDVVMVGEIRDAETAQVAIQASLTGHLVLSTLHTNDAAGAVTRLLDMGIEAFLVSSSVLAVMAQRLVRCLCASCREPYQITEQEIRELAVPEEMMRGKTIYKPGTGPCATCQGTRYFDRTGIHELLMIDDIVRPLILQRADSNTIKAAAMRRGFKTLRMDGAEKILKGMTSVEEVIMATHEEQEVLA
jgi:general secretion pathway protein E